MSDKLKVFLILLVVVFIPILSFAETNTSNVGFLPSNIWYSDEPDTEGEKIRIYTVVFNPYQKEFSGKVLFYDNDVLLGKKDFTVPSIGTKEVYIDWTVNLGTHKIFAKIADTKYLVSKGTYEPVNLKEDTSDISSYTVYKKVLPKLSDIKENINTAVDESSNAVEKIEGKILSNTPEYVSKPIISTSNFLEEWRTTQAEVVLAKKISTASQIDAIEKSNSEATFLKEEPTTTANTENLPKEETGKKKLGQEFKTSTFTPFKYIELFFLTLLSYIVGIKIIFYGTLVIILALFIRLIWKRFF